MSSINTKENDGNTHDTEDASTSKTMLYQSNTDLIEKLGLSLRSHNALRRAGIHTIDDMLALDYEQMCKIKNVGPISICEIEQMQEKIRAGGCFGFIDTEVTDSEEHSMQAEKNCAKFISSFVSYIPTYAGKLYSALLPEFKTALKNDAPINLDVLFEAPVLRNLVTTSIISILEGSPFGIQIGDIFSLLPDALVSTNTINTILQELEEDGQFIIDQTTIEFYRPGLWEYVDSVSDERQREALMMRLRGYTFEEIGKKLGGLNRERIRQIITKFLRNKNVTIKEDRYKELFETYCFLKEDFQLAFDTDDSVYIYLNWSVIKQAQNQ